MKLVRRNRQTAPCRCSKEVEYGRAGEDVKALCVLVLVCSCWCYLLKGCPKTSMHCFSSKGSRRSGGGGAG